MSTYRLSILALRDIGDIGLQIGRDNRSAAEQLIIRLYDLFSLLAENPGIGRLRAELGNVRSIAVRPYVIYYRKEAQGIEIIRVLHGARDLWTAWGEQFYH